MISSIPWQPVFQGLDDPSTRGSTQNTLAEIVRSLAEEERNEFARQFEVQIPSLTSSDGRGSALDLLDSFAPEMAVRVSVALTLDPNDHGRRRDGALRLKRHPESSDARSALLRLLADPVTDVKQIAVEALPGVMHSAAQEPSTSSVQILTAELQQEALDLLEQLEMAINKLQDLSLLAEAGNEIVDEVVLPTIA